jgi:KaiC/GvpD/RAD55 family RecA-like ATPase
MSKKRGNNMNMRETIVQRNKQEALQKHSFKSISLSELREQTKKPPRILLAPFIKQGEATLIYAASGLGKSFFTLGLAVAMASGSEFVGYEAPEPLKVKYIDGEMSQYDLMARLEASIGDRITDKSFMRTLENNLLLSNRELCTPEDGAFFDIATKEHIKEIVRELLQEGVDVAVFDNFSTLALGVEDENSAGSFNVTLELILALKAVDILPILVHHSNKNGTNYRGTTKIEAVFSNIIGLHRDSSIKKELGAGFIIKFDKNRSEYHKLLDTRTVQCLKDEKKWVQLESEDIELVRTVEAIKSLEFTNQTEVAAGLGVSQGAISKRLPKCIVQGLITDKEIQHCYQYAKEIRDGEVESHQVAELEY